jgi:hypothetical protein
MDGWMDRVVNGWLVGGGWWLVWFMYWNVR